MRRLLRDKIESQYVIDENGCWKWTASIDSKGYGQLTHNMKVKRAHRMSYLVKHGVLPDNMYVCHKCDVRDCINPDHLFLGTALDNVSDMDRKGRRVNKHPLGEEHHAAILTEDQVKEIRSYPHYKVPRKQLAEKFGVSPTTISQVRSNRNWRHI